MQAGYSYAPFGVPQQMSYTYPQQNGGLTEQQLRQIYALQQPSYGTVAQTSAVYQQQPPHNQQYVQVKHPSRLSSPSLHGSLILSSLIITY